MVGSFARFFTVSTVEMPPIFLLGHCTKQSPVTLIYSIGIKNQLIKIRTCYLSLQLAINLAEMEFLNMVEQEVDERPDLVSIGSCVLLVLLHGKNLYVLNLGDSRAVLATYDKGIDGSEREGLRAVKLTGSHTVDDEDERIRLLNDHLDDPCTVVGGKVKGKLKVTRAFGVGYLKKVLVWKS